MHAPCPTPLDGWIAVCIPFYRQLPGHATGRSGLVGWPLDACLTVRSGTAILKQAFDSGPQMHTHTRNFSTKDRILYAAEVLFAQQGFAATSLRQVTGRADVNIAAVNYHFGSKENLVNEVFRRRMDTMSEQRLAALEAARKDAPGQLEPILAAFVEPALAMAQDRHGGADFIRVIARAYAESNASLRKFLSDRYGHVLREFAKAISECAPGLGKETLYFRLDFLAGALTYAMADFGLIKRPTGTSEASHRQRAANALIRFAAAGFQAED